MSEEEIFAAVKEIAEEELDVDEGKITMDANIKEDLDADSLDLFEIVNELEDKYDIDLDADEDTKTVGDVVKLVKEAVDDKD
ncbi:acyl carrier protein [Lactobacillus porci]|jgi:acyl carrier protein|uniref:acyl carrier protein n=1 Tax=Lactobacillus porci TaxID=2012477 RepID=UPI003993A1D4